MDQPTPASDADTARIEVTDRLRAIGRLAQHVAAGSLDPEAAVGTAQELLNMARGWCL